ncbi:hypothetical protein, partial [Bifidobacterium longum]|uniref:hypothetical protein n=1 Tax=Bifidobacterium longum TaxID=216816 RepID=UPI001F422F75
DEALFRENRTLSVTHRTFFTKSRMISRKTYAELQALECEESIAPYGRTLDGKEAEEIQEERRQEGR